MCGSVTEERIEGTWGKVRARRAINGTFERYRKNRWWKGKGRGIRVYRRAGATAEKRAGIRGRRDRSPRDGVGRGVTFSFGDHPEARRDGAARRDFSGRIRRRRTRLHRVRAGN